VYEETGHLRRIRHGEDLYHLMADFLFDEAALLDARRHDEWLTLLADDIRYVVPVRVTTAHTLRTSTADMAHLDEDLSSLRKRVERFATEHAWAEDPPSRTRRNITNIRCWQDEATNAIRVTSNLLLFRSRGDVHDHDLLSAMRADVIRLSAEGPRLARREIWLDESVLRTQNLAIFL
jgi:phthalate 3,4-dioxygenase subunit beta